MAAKAALIFMRQQIASVRKSGAGAGSLMSETNDNAF